MNGRANTRMVVKLAERKTEMIGFNGSYNLIDIHHFFLSFRLQLFRPTQIIVKKKLLSAILVLKKHKSNK